MTPGYSLYILNKFQILNKRCCCALAGAIEGQESITNVDMQWSDATSFRLRLINDETVQNTIRQSKLK